MQNSSIMHVFSVGVFCIIVRNSVIACSQHWTQLNWKRRKKKQYQKRCWKKITQNCFRQQENLCTFNNNDKKMWTTWALSEQSPSALSPILFFWFGFLTCRRVKSERINSIRKSVVGVRGFFPFCCIKMTLVDFMNWTIVF